MNSLKKIIEKLQAIEDVDSVFITGSYGIANPKPYSDIDLVIILKKNKNGIYSFYRWIDGVFADIFFFDLADLKRIKSKAEKLKNPMDSIFMAWLKKADIKFDKSRTLSNMKLTADKNETAVVLIKEKQTFWQKINYNFVANKRYFDSNNELYREALELRLLYSVIELICGFLALRNVAWRGEKEAVLYLKSNHPDFYKLFQEYSKSATLETRFGLYEQMCRMTFTDDYKKWTENDEILIKEDLSIGNPEDFAVKYVKSLFS